MQNAHEIAAWRLCTGCGVCVYACPEKKIRMQDFPEEGIRPVHEQTGCGECRECVEACPGYRTESQQPPGDGILPALESGWGPVLEVWEGYAADPDLRFQGSSGGAASAIALFALEKEGLYGVLHTGSDPDIPWKNRTVLSRNRRDLISRTGSRYSPASPGDLLGLLEASPLPSVFIGKPCDVAGVRKIQRMRAEIRGRIGIAIGIFCAGTPATRGTLDLFERLEIDPHQARELRYRGRGWPGMFAVNMRGNLPGRKIPYMEAWEFLERYRPFRCYLCPDATGEFADISCGDPWYRRIEEGEAGHSLILVRTARGRRTVQAAIEAGYLVLERVETARVMDLNRTMLAKRQAIWGRIAALKAFGVPAPHYGGFRLFEKWLHAPAKEKARSLLGTARRIVRRGYRKPVSR